MTEPIFEHLWHDLTGHLPHHHRTTMTSSSQQPPEATMHPITAIENDITAAEGHVSETVHAILTKHIGVARMAAYVADETAKLAAGPIAALVETAAGVSPAEQVFLARVTSLMAHELDGFTAAVMPAVPAPAPAAAGDVPTPEPAPTS